MGRTQAHLGEGVGLHLPERHPDHEDPEWYQRDLDQEEDAPAFDPFPTPRHSRIPSWPYPEED